MPDPMYSWGTFKSEADKMKDKLISWSPGALLLILSLLLNAVMGFYLLWRPNPGRSENPAADPARHRSILQLGNVPPSVRLSRTSILNTLVEKYGYTSYLEIGQGPRTLNFDWVQCPIKIGVDPDRKLNAAYQMTSDDFFKMNNDTFDLIFVDGLHHAEQVERDILNALKILNEKGTILVHDCNPQSEDMQTVPRKQQLFWTGDVWRAWVKLRATRSDLKMYVIDSEFGCGLIRRGHQDTIALPGNVSYALLAENRRAWLNLIDGSAFLDDLKHD